MPKFPNNPRILKAKLASYESFNDIAHSIQLVAFAKLKKLKKKIDSRFVSLRFLKTLLKNYYTLSEKDVDNSCLVILFTSDKSCCGAINNPILNYTNSLVSSLKLNGVLTFIIPIGKKGYNLLKRKYKSDITYRLVDLDLDMNFWIASYILLEQIIKINFSNCYIFFAQFINNFLQEVTSYKFPSFSSFFSLIISDARESNLVFDIFINKNLEDKSFIIDFYSFFISLLILDVFEESEYSQLGAKAKTMDIAIQNVSETIVFLRLKYNKLRQSIITNEIIEILNASIAILE